MAVIKLNEDTVRKINEDVDSYIGVKSVKEIFDKNQVKYNVSEDGTLINFRDDFDEVWELFNYFLGENDSYNGPDRPVWTSAGIRLLPGEVMFENPFSIKKPNIKIKKLKRYRIVNFQVYGKYRMWGSTGSFIPMNEKEADEWAKYMSVHTKSERTAFIPEFKGEDDDEFDNSTAWFKGNPYKLSDFPLQESLDEDTVKKSNGKWTNRGDDGTEHGEFKTKKQADAQRRAMYANGYKGESLKESYSDGKLSIEDLEQIRDRVTDLIDALNDFEVTEIQAEPNTYKIGHPYIGTYSGFVDLSDPYKYVGEDDEDYEYESLKEGITEIRSKKVEDGDGFDTDYTMYKDDAGYFFMLGDKDFYPPERSRDDYECDTEDEANEWFDSYSSTGCYEDEYEYESLKESYGEDSPIDLALMSFESGHYMDESDFEDNEEDYEEYMTYIEMGPQGFYDEFRDELDFSQDFIDEYGDEDDFGYEESLVESAEDYVQDVSYLFDMYPDYDVVTGEILGRDSYYHTLLKSVNDAERFNYHSDYWGDADSYQNSAIEVVDDFEPYVDKKISFEVDGEKYTGVFKGVLIDKQYNSHLKFLIEPDED